MIAKLLFFLINVIFSGSHFPASSSTVLATFNRNILVGDVNALRSLINSNSEYITNPATMQYRNDGFLSAVQRGRTSVVDLLLKNANVDASTNNNEAIIHASANGDYKIVKLLLARPEVNPGALGNRALNAASRNGHTEVVKLLLKEPVVKSSERYYLAAYIASELNHADIVKLFIGDGIINPKGIKILFLDTAAKYGDVGLVRHMLQFPMYNQEAHLVFMADNLVSIRTVIEAGYQYDKETIENALVYHRSLGNDDIVDFLETLIDKPKLPEKPLIAMTEQCAICLSNENLMEGYMTSCQHQFHVGCLQSWIAKHNSCPMCRSSI